MAFKYRKPSQEAMEKHATQQGGSFLSFIRDEYRTYSPKKGDNAIRILPRDEKESAEHYTEEVWVHYGIGPDRGSVICPYKMAEMPCPICEEHARLERMGEEKAASDIKVVRRSLMWLVDRKNEEHGPLLWAAAWTIDRDISKQAKDRETGRYYFVDDPEQGYDVYFDRDGEGLTTKYSGFQLARRPSRVDPKHLDFVEKNPMLDALIIRDYNELKAIFEGAMPGEKKEESAERPPPPADDKAATTAEPTTEGRVRLESPREDPPFDTEGAKTREPPPEEQQEERRPDPPPPSSAPPREPEPVGSEATSGKSKADALRARFAAKG